MQRDGAGRIKESAEQMSALRWPTYWQSIPKHVVIVCPVCHAAIVCDVDLCEDAASQAELTVAVAEIDTALCEACGDKLCPKCPQTKDLHGFTLCAECGREDT